MNLQASAKGAAPAKFVGQGSASGGNESSRGFTPLEVGRGHKRSRLLTGFTLIEMLLTLGIFVFVGVAVLPLYGNFSVSTQLNEETTALVATLRLARARSLSGWHNLNHGICFESPAGAPARYVLYEGASCATRVAGTERVTDFSSALNFSLSWLGNDLNFNAQGVPSVTGTITLTHSTAGTSVITITNLGLVEEN